MNVAVQQLFDIAKKESRLILGLMSGTSLDGLDIALCRVKNTGTNTQLELLNFTTIPYETALKNDLRSICFKKNINAENLCLLHQHLGSYYATLINQTLTSWKIAANKIDLIASHGQTIYHAPKRFHQQTAFNNATFQLGDADQIAVKTGIITVSDFRQKHIAGGGEGAPLAAYGDYLLFAHPEKNRILLNIGGISNLTYLPAGEKLDNIICTDIGPGNTLMDAWCQKKFNNLNFDTDARIAKKGFVNEKLLKELLTHSFFASTFPTTTGPEDFNLEWLEACIRKVGKDPISKEDVMATLNTFTAASIISAINKIIPSKQSVEILISGGGANNPLVFEKIKSNFKDHLVETTDYLKMDPDAKEAILFALLANETIAGNSSTFGIGSTNMPAIGMGKISFPT